MPAALGSATRTTAMADAFLTLFSARAGIIADAEAEDDVVRAACDIATAVESMRRRLAGMAAFRWWHALLDPLE